MRGSKTCKVEFKSAQDKDKITRNKSKFRGVLRTEIDKNEIGIRKLW